MNPIEQLKAYLEGRLGHARLSLDVPADTARGAWWLEVEDAGRRVVVEWRPGTTTFGISVLGPETGLGEAADEWRSNVSDAAARVTELLAHRYGRSQAAR